MKTRKLKTMTDLLLHLCHPCPGCPSKPFINQLRSLIFVVGMHIAVKKEAIEETTQQQPTS